MTDIAKDYLQHKKQADLLRWGLPEDKKPKSEAAIAEWKLQIEEHTQAMAKIAKRLTWTQRIELGIHPSQNRFTP